MQTLTRDSKPSIEIDSPRAVEQRTDLDSTTIWRMRRRGEFPQPIQLSPGRKGYIRSEIDAWLTARAQRTEVTSY